MKKSSIYPRNGMLALAVLLLLLPTACSNDSEDKPEEKAFAVALKLYGSTENRVDASIEKVTLFVFNDQDQFVGQVKLTNDEIAKNSSISLDYVKTDYLTVLAWGNLSEEYVTINPLNTGSKIDDLKFTIKGENGNPCGENALYFGQQKVMRSSSLSLDPKVIEMKNKVSYASIQVIGVSPDNANAFQCLIKGGIARIFDYKGEAIEEFESINVALKPNVNGLSSDIYIVYPANSDSQIELYNDGQLYTSIDINIEGPRPLRFEEGLSIQAQFVFDDSATGQ